MLVRLIRTLPKARRWAQDVVTAHAEQSRRLDECGFKRLSGFASLPVMRRVRLVVVEHVPRPPFEKWGLHGADDFAGFEASGIALLRTIFIKTDCGDSESTVFHELVHVLQWETLGINRFLALYGLQLLAHGYSESPLEIMAYDLQGRFDSSDASFDLEPIVARRTQEALANFEKRSIVHRAASLILAFAPGRMQP